MSASGRGTRFLPGLDGLRAVSIVLVMLSHLMGTADSPTFPGWIWHFGDLGNLGVRIFFVISGFLITHLLLQEEGRSGRISLYQFYLRRAFRILPPLWTFLGGMLLLRMFGLMHFPDLQAFQALLFTANYRLGGTDWNLGHLWSLAVEEQFYLLWPLVLVFLPRRHRLKFLLAAVVLGPIVRAGLLWWRASQGNPTTEALPVTFFASMDALAAGCALALLREEGWLPRWWTHQRHPGLTALILCGVIAILNGIQVEPLHFQALVLPAINVLVTLLIDLASLGRAGLLQFALDCSPIQWLGRLSYSLYLWQEPFLNRNRSEWFTTFPVNLILALTAAVASYYLVEKPALALRPLPKTSGR